MLTTSVYPRKSTHPTQGPRLLQDTRNPSQSVPYPARLSHNQPGAWTVMYPARDLNCYVPSQTVTYPARDLNCYVPSQTVTYPARLSTQSDCYIPSQGPGLLCTQPERHQPGTYMNTPDRKKNCLFKRNISCKTRSHG